MHPSPLRGGAAAAGRVGDWRADCGLALLLSFFPQWMSRTNVAFHLPIPILSFRPLEFGKTSKIAFRAIFCHAMLSVIETGGAYGNEAKAQAFRALRARNEL